MGCLGVLGRLGDMGSLLTSGPLISDLLPFIANSRGNGQGARRAKRNFTSSKSNFGGFWAAGSVDGVPADLRVGRGYQPGDFLAESHEFGDFGCAEVERDF